jgi:enamine deaminase RidA (YjgF/YER057c/UK114 family)
MQRVGGDPPSPWEERYGYSRAVIVGGLIHLGGTTAVGPLGAIVGETPYEQMTECLRKPARGVAAQAATAARRGCAECVVS